MLKDMIKFSLLQKGQNDRIMNIVFVFYGIQWSLNNFELSATIMTNSRFPNQNHIRVLPSPTLSPDLSPIWSTLGRGVRHRKNTPETLQELRDTLVHE
jgi:hypothetical protein